MENAFRPGDLRAWLDRAGAMGQVQTLSGAHWDKEIGAIAELAARRPSPPALLFEDIPDYARGFRLLTCAAANPLTLALTLRLGGGVTDNLSLMRTLRGGRMRAWEREASAYAWRWVDDGPVAACVEEGEDVDLRRFPAPLWHERDGGRYLGTGCAVITRDPESGRVNAGAYRCMLAGPREMTIQMATPSRHGHIHVQSHFARGEPCPVAVCLGHDPLFGVLAGIEVSEDVCEFDVCGAVAGEPVRMLRGRATGLPIPADAELVVEGWLHPGDEHVEGPYGEFTGYYSGTPRQTPVLRVAASYHRPDPIVLGSPPSKPPHDFSYYFTALRSALIHDQIEGAGIPGVQAVWADEVGGGRMLICVSIRQRHAGHARQVAHVASQCQAGAYFGRYVIVVDDDVDPTDLRDVMWAVLTRSDPAADIDVIRRAWGSPLDPLHGMDGSDSVCNSRALIDACRPFERRDAFPPVAAASPELRDAVRRKWRDALARQPEAPEGGTAE